MAIDFTAPVRFQIYQTGTCFTVYLTFVANPEIPNLQLVAPPMFGQGNGSKGNQAIGHDTLSELRTWALEVVKAMPAKRPDLLLRGVYEMVSNNAKEAV